VLYVPALFPERLTLVSEATPLEFVVADPTKVPFRVKLMETPLTGVPPEVTVKVALTFVIPP
jgi:hypothetical protein